MDTNEKKVDKTVKSVKSYGGGDCQTHDLIPRMRLKGRTVDDADWSDVNIHNSYFIECDLGSSNFMRANMRHAEFNTCTLRRSDFTGADLSNAKFVACDLSRADFRNANLMETSLERSDIHGSRGIVHLGLPHLYNIYAVQHDSGVMIQAGCRWMTYREAVAYWEDQGDDKPLSQPLLAYLREIVRIKEWNLGPTEWGPGEKEQYVGRLG